MIHLYHVYCRGQYVVTVRAYSKESAEYQAYMSHGSASKYSGPSVNDFTAVEVGLYAKEKE
jgi:hypothetical protein